MLANLFCLLMGFRAARATLKRAFRGDPASTCRTTGKAVSSLLVMVFVLSSFLDNIAAALIGGAMAHQLFKGSRHRRLPAAIVACSNAGGSGPVVGDTTTTMMDRRR